MPLGVIVMHWDERVGVEVVAKYPDEVELQEKTMMQIYSQHEFSGDSGFVTLMAGSINIASFYTGRETAIYVMLVLTLDEICEVYEEGLSELARQVLINLNSTALKAVLPNLFQRLSVYPTMTEEQRYAMFFQNEIKRLVLKRLREEVSFPKSELAIWLKDQYKSAFVDIEGLTNDLVKSNIMKLASVKGYVADMLFFVNDIYALRVPPVNLVKDPVGHHLPASLKDSYISEVRNFFGAYKPNEPDALKVINDIILDTANYEVLKLLRAALVTRSDLEKLRKKGVDDLDKSLKAMWNNKMIAVFQDDTGTEYYCLISDFVIDRYFPRYLLDLVRDQYRTKAQNANTLLKALDLIEEEYNLNAKKPKKSKTQKSEIEA